MALLPRLLCNSLAGSTASSSAALQHPNLIIITDSILQPGLLLLRQFVSSAAEQQDAIVVLSLEQTKTRLVPNNVDAGLLRFVDRMTAQSTAASTSATDIQQSERLALEHSVIDSVNAAVSQTLRQGGRKVLVVLDSANAIAEAGVDALHSIVRKTLKAIAVVKELLARDYGVTIPVDNKVGELDVKLTSFLRSFSSRSWGDPFVAPTRHGDQDERVPLDLGGREDESSGKCVVEWSTRGIASISVNVRNSDSQHNPTRRVVNRGLEGLRRTKQGVRAASLAEVLDERRMRLVDFAKLVSDGSAATAATFAQTSSSAPTAGAGARAQPGYSSKVEAKDGVLPFNLSLTDAQHLAREDVALPFKPREDGGMYRGGAISYQAEPEDDIDDEDPDEDLEI
ncbi:hypothetical protein OIO90_005777 [Microbotryomycetes sp. JL221]|nr:hypothetical protein OIO90_005777 [Microbotryomycetes sp. JL221]